MFSVMKQSNVSNFVENTLKNAPDCEDGFDRMKIILRDLCKWFAI